MEPQAASDVRAKALEFALQLHLLYGPNNGKPDVEAVLVTARKLADFLFQDTRGSKPGFGNTPHTVSKLRRGVI